MFNTFLVFFSILFVSVWVFWSLSSFYYTVLIVISVTLFLFWLILSGFVNSFLLLLMVIVYVGAMMIMVGYVCSVVPNEKFQMMLSNKFTYYIIMMFMFMVSLTFSYNSLESSITLSQNWSELSFMLFSSLGFYIMCLILILLLIVMVLSTRLLSTKSSFRSLD